MQADVQVCEQRMLQVRQLWYKSAPAILGNQCIHGKPHLYRGSASSVLIYSYAIVYGLLILMVLTTAFKAACTGVP